MSFAPAAIGNASGSLSITSSQTISSSPQLSGGGGPTRTSITTHLETIPTSGTGVPVGPTITTQVASQTVTVGQPATFSVTASGEAPLSYQWQKNGTLISGATSATYTTPATATSDSGSQFTVVVSNSTGSVTSNTATLTVNAALVAIAVTPIHTTVSIGSTQQFVGNVTGSSNTAVTWTVKNGAGCTGAACGTISPGGLYVPPSSVPSPATVTVTATSGADPTKSASASVTIVAAVAVLLSISPTSASVPTSGTQLFTASVTGTSNTAVSWSVSGAGCSGSSCGTISTSASSAVYLAPTAAPSPASVNVVATSLADTAKTASASLTLVPGVAVTISPTSASVPAGTTQQFKASVTGTSNTAVAWSVSGPGCSGAACGTINSNGLYTAPAATPSPATATVSATSVADPSKSSSVNLTIVGSGRIGPVLPALPQATVDVTMPTQNGIVRNVAPGNTSDFQAKINAATCGDTIVLVAGSTSIGNFTIPNVNCSGWILIESSALASLPARNHRVGPPNASNMAKIVTNVTNTPAIAFQAGSHNWRLIGLEITTTVGMTQNALITTDVAATVLSQLPNHIIIDRCYVHADVTAFVKRGLTFNVAHGAVVDSDFRNIVSPGNDSQAIAVWNGSGPFLYRNNFLSAASENTLFGGADPGIANLIPSDITIVGNWYWKDYANWLGKGYGVKNSIEFKNAQRILVDGNVFDYSWADAQTGNIVSIKSVNQDGGCSWCNTVDMTFTHNLVRHGSIGILLALNDSSGAQPLNRVLVQNNVLTDISSKYGSGYGFGIETQSSTNGGGMTTSNNETIDHNSIFADNYFLALGDTGKVPAYQFTNNIGDYGTYGIKGAGQSPGTGSLNAFVPNAVYNDIVLLLPGGAGSGYPAGTFFNTDAAAGFTNYAGANYQLLNTSPYFHAGTDGKDIGVWDWSTYSTETSNALNGVSELAP